MANPIKGEVPIIIGERKYTLVLGTYALAAIERRLKMPWAKVMQRATEGYWGIDETLAAFAAALLRHHRDISEEKAADLIDQAGIEAISEALAEAIKLMQAPSGNGGGGQEAENPTPLSSNGVGTISSPAGSP